MIYLEYYIIYTLLHYDLTHGLKLMDQGQQMILFIISLSVFRRKSWAIVISRSPSLLSTSLLSSLCKNFSVAQYLKGIKGINTKLEIHAHNDKMLLQDKGHNSESNSFGIMPL